MHCIAFDSVHIYFTHHFDGGGLAYPVYSTVSPFVELPVTGVELILAAVPLLAIAIIRSVRMNRLGSSRRCQFHNRNATYVVVAVNIYNYINLCRCCGIAYCMIDG